MILKCNIELTINQQTKNRVVKYFSCILVLFFHLSSKGQFKIYSDISDQQFFSKAVPVWIDSRNVKKSESDKFYTLTTSGRHDSRQSEKNLTASFRACFNLEQTSNVVLKLAASTDYRAFVNGKFLGHGPCVAGHGYYRVDEYNLSNSTTPT